MYHRIESVNPRSNVQGHYVSPRLFRSQLLTMKRLGWRTISASEAVRRWVAGEPIEPKSFVITFDDGYENFYTYALSILSELEFDSIVFLVSDLVGKRNEWDIREGDVEERLMSRSQIEDCFDHRVEFGSHTSSHAHLDRLSINEARREIVDSKIALEDMLGKAVTQFCYPYGGTTPTVQALVEEAGYKAAHSTLKGFNTAQTPRFLLRRMNVRSDCSVPVLLYKLWRDRRIES